MNITELQQFAAMAELDSFSDVARAFYVSTPTITRSMRRVERYFGVPLFNRGKNKVTLNATGRCAVGKVARLLDELDAAAADVRAFDLSLRTVSIVSCAPAPLWSLVPRVSRLYPGMTVSSRVANLEQTRAAFDASAADLVVLPYRPEGEGLLATRVLSEGLRLCVKRDHPLAAHESVALADINGFNFLLGSDLGFWNDICRERLTASRFLVQDDEFSLSEIIRSSSLPCFTTDVAVAQRYRDLGPDRVSIPITDPEVNVTFYLVGRDRAKIGKLFA